MKADGQEDPAEREIFDTIKATYASAFEPEQHAMITELRAKLTSISAEERTPLINDIENVIGQNLEELEY